jgi:hypothetical protein
MRESLQFSRLYMTTAPLQQLTERGSTSRVKPGHLSMVKDNCTTQSAVVPSLDGVEQTTSTVNSIYSIKIPSPDLSTSISACRNRSSKLLRFNYISVMLRKLQFFLITLNLLIPILFVIVYLQPSVYPLSHPSQAIFPANSTLGFGTIIAVSHAQSLRRASLLWAANLTDVDIVIPEQPVWTEDDLEEFRSAEGSKISRGSTLAWMGHLNALKW